MEGPIKPESNIESRANILVQKWKHTPVILASSSEYRRNELQNLGYEKVAAVAVPDEEEKNTHSDIIATEGKRGTFFDKQKTEIPRRIAAAKVAYLLEKMGVPSDALVVAFDTLPMSFRRSDERLKDPSISSWPAEHMSKPKNLDEARASIFDLFSYIAAEYIAHESRIQAQIAFETERYEDADPVFIRDLMDAGRLSKLIRINTGMAARFPGELDIQTSSTYIDLRLYKVYELANQPEKLKLLADRVIELMIEQGKDPLNIGGGIDYSDPYVRDLLQVNELDLFLMPEQGIYKGLPHKAFEDFVQRNALRIVQS